MCLGLILTHNHIINIAGTILEKVPISHVMNKGIESCCLVISCWYLVSHAYTGTTFCKFNRLYLLRVPPGEQDKDNIVVYL